MFRQILDLLKNLFTSTCTSHRKDFHKSEYNAFFATNNPRNRRLIIMESDEPAENRSRFYIISDYPLYTYARENELSVYTTWGRKGTRFVPDPPMKFTSQDEVIRKIKAILYQKAQPSHRYKIVFSTLGHDFREIHTSLDYDLKANRS